LIPYSRPKLPDFYTLTQTKPLENHTLYSSTYLYKSYMGVPPGGGGKEETERIEVGGYILLLCRLFNLTASIITV